MFHKIIILSLGIFALTGCDAQKKSKINTKTTEMPAGTKTTSTNSQKDGVIYLNEGENKFLKEYQMNVTFKGVSEDSRCPEGVNCIWAGAALAQVEVMGTSTRPMILNLASIDYPGRNYRQSAEFNGYTITLQDVAPYPKQQDGTKALAGKYKIGITIKKADQSTDSTTK
ncbi:hypothetical protein KYG33_08650 [Chryseobacterium sp. D764]|jgi:hypothetical protein|uniref:hypothetical protein n=1 Tax=unclassified Chryseobacterium TaxID=2593645 RepID=UPI0009862F9A|nr:MULTISPECIES: hypothetical protein [unclassified Chryseobacterium]QXU51094.1 hypothetical protein KYG33_08650 [Chryseobacterium sp. D764]CAD0220530.1 conserved protein of unknown function [Chryseobacterium sp. JV274]